MDEQVNRSAESSAATPRRARPLPRAPLLLMLVLVLIGGGVAWRLSQGKKPARPPMPPIAVGVAPAKSGDMPIVLKGLGTVTPLATVTVRTQINGQLQTIAFHEGQRVHRGDFLAQIDPRPYEALLAQYQGQLARDTALLKQAQTNYARYQVLNRQDSISRQQVEDQFYLVRQYEGSIAADQAQIDTEKLNLIYCHIVSPVDGRIGIRQVDQGNYVQTSDTNGLVVVTQIQPISVIFTLPEDVLPQVMPRLHAGAKLPVEAWDREDAARITTGTLDTVDNEIDTTTGTVKLRAIFSNADESLFPNQFVNAHLLVDTLHGAVLVPNAAIQHGAPGTFVYVVKDNAVSIRPITTGAADAAQTVVLSGLTPGETVVTDGIDRLRDGAKVRLAGGHAAGGDRQAPQRHQRGAP
jgi:membrane fusion protein, multidrug efflux system